MIARTVAEILDKITVEKMKSFTEKVILFLAIFYLIFASSNRDFMAFNQSLLVNVILVSVIGVAWFGWKIKTNNQFQNTSLDFPILLYLFAIVIATIFSEDPRRSLTIIPEILTIVLIFYLTVDLFRAGWPVNFVNKIILLFTTIILFHGLLQIIGWYLSWLKVGGFANPFPPIPYRVGSVFQSPNILAAFINLTLPLAIVYLLQTKRNFSRLLIISWLLTSFIVLVFTSSRGGWLGTIVIHVIFVVYYFSEVKLFTHRFFTLRVVKIPLYVIVGIISIPIYALLVRFIIWEVSHPSHGFGLNRESIWAPAIHMFLKNPLTGNGPFTYGTTYINLHSFPPSRIIHHAHSLFFNTLGETGLLGTLSLFWLLISVVLIVLSNWKNNTARQHPYILGISAALASLFIHSIFDFPQVLPVMNAITAIYLAQFISIETKHLKYSQPFKTLIIPTLWILLLGTLLWNVRTSLLEGNGIAAANHGEWDQAAKLLSLNAESDPKLAIHWFQAGFAHGILALDRDGNLRNKEELNKAISAYKKGLSIEPSYSLNWANLSVLEWANGDHNEAINHMKVAASGSRYAYPFFLNLGIMYESKGLLAPSKNSYERALELEPMLFQSEVFEKSEFRRAILNNWASQQIDNLDYSINNGWLHFRNKNFDQSIKIFQHYANNNNAEGYLGLGLSLVEIGDLENAEFMLKASNFISAEHGWVRLQSHLGLIDIYLAEGRTQKIVEEGETVLKLLESISLYGPGNIYIYGYPSLIFFHRYYETNDILPGFEMGIHTRKMVQILYSLQDAFDEAGMDREEKKVKEIIFYISNESTYRKKIYDVFETN